MAWWTGRRHLRAAPPGRDDRRWPSPSAPEHPCDALSSTVSLRRLAAPRLAQGARRARAAACRPAAERSSSMAVVFALEAGCSGGRLTSRRDTRQRQQGGGRRQLMANSGIRWRLERRRNRRSHVPAPALGPRPRPEIVALKIVLAASGGAELVHKRNAATHVARKNDHDRRESERPPRRSSTSRIPRIWRGGDCSGGGDKTRTRTTTTNNTTSGRVGGRPGSFARQTTGTKTRQATVLEAGERRISSRALAPSLLLAVAVPCEHAEATPIKATPS